jgi:GNAT superfamily N-acetyltransferase
MIQIGSDDRQRHEAFFRFVPRIFPGLDFRLWYARCGWPSSFVVHAFREGEEIVASVASSAMEMLVRGRPCSAWQLGTVGTIPEQRGRGLAARLMEEVVGRAVAAAEPVFLFANDEVLDFYPRFGMRRAQECAFVVRQPIRPAPNPAPRLELDQPEHLRLLERLSACALPVTERFGARNYGTILLWHATYAHPEDLYYLDELDAVIVARAAAEVLTVYDVIAQHPFDLAAVLPRVIEREIARVEFGFTPERWWPTAVPERPHSELFVRGLELPTEPFKFPVLSHT